MCNFLSAIITPKGDVLWHPMVDSHSELVRLFDLKDTKVGKFAKVELTPGDNWLDVSKWNWRIDENTRPAWLDDVESQAEKKLRAIAKSMLIVDETRDLIVDGCYILGGKAVVNEIKAGRILSVRDSATINYVRDSATIKDVGGSATIKDVGGSATIKDVGGSATINYVRDSATINYVGGSATIKDVGGSATIKDVGGSAKIVTDRRVKSAK
jgi:hypothetical protein